MLTFNDDIQGTTAVAGGAVVGAVKVTATSLKDQQIVMLGAGSAGTGVADGLRAAMTDEGLSEQEARSRFMIVDKNGLLHWAEKTSPHRDTVRRRRSNSYPVIAEANHFVEEGAESSRPVGQRRSGALHPR